MRVKKALPACLRLLALVCCLALLNLVAACIDTPSLREHARQACIELRDQGATPQLVGGMKSTQLDNYSAVLILKTAGYTGPETLLQRAYGGFRTDMPAEEGESGWDAFCHYADGSESPTGGLSYSRYWHGYLLPLRLLLVFFDLPNIQMLLLLACGLLVSAIVALLPRRGLFLLIVPLIVTLTALGGPVMALCVQFAPVTLLALGFSALLLWKPGRFATAETFAVLGILTAYLDLLTAPMLAFCLPLTFAVALRLGNKKASFARLAREAIGWVIGFGIGYAGMWALKWLLNGLLFGGDYVTGVFSQIALRTSTASHSRTFSRLYALTKSAGLLLAKPALRFSILLGLAACALPALRRRRGVDARALLLLLPAAIPLVFMLATANHVVDHTYFALRNWGGTMLAGYALVALFWGGHSAS